MEKETKGEEEVPLKYYLKPKEEVKGAARYLYNKIQLREALLLSKRVDYFRGHKLVDALYNEADHHPGVEPGVENKKNKKTEKGKPECRSKEDAISVGKALLKHGFIHAAKIKNKAKRELIPVTFTPTNLEFDPDLFYIWVVEFKSFKRNLMLSIIIIGFLSAVMFPVWPQTLKVSVWYLSVTLLLLLTSIIFVRLFLYLALWMLFVEFWLFPNLFDDEANFFDSFKPIFSFQTSDFFSNYSKLSFAEKLEHVLSRLFCIAVVLFTAFYVYNQPNEFEEIMVIQRQFMSDLYEGKLLSDEQENKGDNKNFGFNYFPDLEKLKKEIEEEQNEDEVLNDILNEPIEEED